jgi:hypothetical protein
MATIKDFILRAGLQVNTSATVAGVDVLANDFATYTTLQSELRANDYATYTTLQGELSANDFNTLNTARANDYNTYTTLQGELRANDYNTYTTLLGIIDNVQANVGGGSSAAAANDYNTYTTLQGEYRANDYNTYTTLQGEFAANDVATLQSARANDYATYTTLQGELAANDYSTYTTLQGEYRANDYNTYTTLQGEFAANDGATLSSARANDYSTYTTLQGELAANDYSTYTTLQGEYRANDYSTYTTLQGEFAANDYNTYTTLQGELRANDYSTYTALQSELAANDFNTLQSARANDYATYTTLQSEYRANDGVTLNSALANDGVTLSSALANDYNTYTTLVNEYNANDYSTYTTLQGEYRANDYATWSGLNAFVSIKANSSVNIVAGDGIAGGGDLTSNVSVAVDSTVVRTSGNQSINGIKTFSDNVVVLGDLTVEGNTTTIGTTSLLVTDKFIELASNTVGTPAGDVGIYLNRGDFGNSAIYYEQAGGYFALAETADPATNTSVSPTSFANLRVNHLRVDSSDLVTNLNADLLDGQSGAYYSDFANASNTNYITLDYVTANGSSTTNSISVGGLEVDVDTLYVDAANDRVGINTSTPRAEFQVSNVALSTSTISTTSNSQTMLDSLAVADFRSAKYIVQAHDTVTNTYQISEILLIHDGVSAYLTEYAIIYTTGSLGVYDAALVSGDIRLSVTPTSVNSTTFKAYRQALTI